jgi:hypothetical protein
VEKSSSDDMVRERPNSGVLGLRLKAGEAAEDDVENVGSIMREPRGVDGAPPKNELFGEEEREETEGGMFATIVGAADEPDPPRMVELLLPAAGVDTSLSM